MMPAIDEMLTMDPPPALRMAGTANFMPSKTPFWLTSVILFHNSRLVASNPAMSNTPALLISTCSPPNACSQVSTARCQSASWVTSRCR